jgi:hypothetical protein
MVTMGTGFFHLVVSRFARQRFFSIYGHHPPRRSPDEMRGDGADGDTAGQHSAAGCAEQSIGNDRVRHRAHFQRQNYANINSAGASVIDACRACSEKTLPANSPAGLANTNP